MSNSSIDLQLLNAFASLLLLLSFAMLSQRRIVTMVKLLAMQGMCRAGYLVAGGPHRTNHLYYRGVHPVAQGAVRHGCCTA
jgi:hydrogenase-4 component E